MTFFGVAGVGAQPERLNWTHVLAEVPGPVSRRGPERCPDPA